MALRTVEQVRRIFRIVAGFTLLGVGVVMIVTPGPGWLTILVGLGLLAAEFVWARRLMDRLKQHGNRIREHGVRIKEAVLRQDKESNES
jgi:tellurite resistance protein TerC